MGKESRVGFCSRGSLRRVPVLNENETTSPSSF